MYWSRLNTELNLKFPMLWSASFLSGSARMIQTRLLISRITRLWVLKLKILNIFISVDYRLLKPQKKVFCWIALPLSLGVEGVKSESLWKKKILTFFRMKKSFDKKLYYEEPCSLCALSTRSFGAPRIGATNRTINSRLDIGRIPCSDSIILKIHFFQVLVWGRFELKYKRTYFVIIEPEKSNFNRNNLVIFQFDFHTVSICDVHDKVYWLGPVIHEYFVIFSMPMLNWHWRN